MSKTIFVNYDEIYARTQELTAYIESDILGEADSWYGQITQTLEQVDSATNAALLEAMTLNKVKTATAANTLKKLLGFIEHSARELQREEQKMAEQINEGGEE